MNTNVERHGREIWLYVLFDENERKAITVGTVEVRLKEMIQKFSCSDEGAAELLLKEMKESDKNRTPFLIGGF